MQQNNDIMLHADVLCGLHADSFPPQSFCVSAWYQQGPAEAPAIIYSCDLNHTHNGMEACRSVSTARVCSWAFNSQVFKITIWAGIEHKRHRRDVN